MQQLPKNFQLSDEGYEERSTLITKAIELAINTHYRPRCNFATLTRDPLRMRFHEVHLRIQTY